jgi:hypothetical protein
MRYKGYVSKGRKERKHMNTENARRMIDEMMSDGGEGLEMPCCELYSCLNYSIDFMTNFANPVWFFAYENKENIERYYEKTWKLINELKAMIAAAKNKTIITNKEIEECEKYEKIFEEQVKKFSEVEAQTKAEIKKDEEEDKKNPEYGTDCH